MPRMRTQGKGPKICRGQHTSDAKLRCSVVRLVARTERRTASSEFPWANCGGGGGAVSASRTE
eukprot:2363425-Prorocentrum_lima.AAC.1